MDFVPMEVRGWLTRLCREGKVTGPGFLLMANVGLKRGLLYLCVRDSRVREPPDSSRTPPAWLDLGDSAEQTCSWSCRQGWERAKI